MPIIDRRLPLPRRKSRRPIGFLMTIVLASSLTMVALLQLQRSNDVSEPPAPARIAYLTHAPIFINGNDGFLVDNSSTGISWGSGTASDPYIIENWDMNASTAMIGISINDTDSHFIVKNCYVHESGGGYPSYPGGINLRNCTNGTLDNNICSNKNHAGIKLESSSNNTVSNNSCSGNDFEGIWLDDSDDNTLNSNTCRGNMYGILLIDSRNNMLINNTCSGWNGIKLDSSNNNTLSHNNCSNTVHGIELDSSSNNDLSRNQMCNNTYSYSGGYGVYIWSGSNNMIWNNTFIGNNGATDTYDASHIQAYDDGTNNWWNSTDCYGNWWNDWQSPDNVPPYGRVDQPYSISGSAGAEDYYPMTTLASNNLPPSFVSFSISAYGPPQGPPWEFVGEAVHCAVVLADPELDAIELIWNFGDGSPSAYFNLTNYVDGNVTCQVDHAYASPGNYTIVLRFTDNQGSPTDHSREFDELIRVLVDDIPPVPDAGENQTVVAPTVVHFNGTGSHDDWGKIANYTWTFVYDGTPVTLWGPTPSFEFTKAGIYEATLNVTDHVGNHNTTTVTIEIVNAVPEFGIMPFVVIALMALIVITEEVRRRKES